MVTNSGTFIPKQKDLFFQGIRALCIIAVLLIHSLSGGEGTETSNYFLVYRQFVNFPVAVFIFLSGYFCSVTSYKSIGPRLKRIVYPYLFWSILYMIFWLVNGIRYSASDVLLVLLMGKAAGPLYYLVVLIQLIVISPILKKIINMNNRFLDIVCYTVSLAYLLILYCYGYLFSETFPDYLLWFPGWLGFYYWGMRMKSGKFSLNVNLFSIFIFLIFSVFFSIWEAFVINLNMHLYTMAISQIKISSFMYSVSIILMLFKIKEFTTFNKWFIKIGDLSFGIFLIHIFFVLIVNKVMHFFVSESLLNILFLQLVQVLLVLIMSVFFIFMIKKVLRNRDLSYFGID